MFYLRPQRDSKKYQRSFEEYEKSIEISGDLGYVSDLFEIPIPIYRGGGGQTNLSMGGQTNYIFVRLGNPGMLIQPPQMEFWNDIC